jgi:hypothetical protein
MRSMGKTLRDCLKEAGKGIFDVSVAGGIIFLGAVYPLAYLSYACDPDVNNVDQPDGIVISHHEIGDLIKKGYTFLKQRLD